MKKRHFVLELQGTNVRSTTNSKNRAVANVRPIGQPAFADSYVPDGWLLAGATERETTSQEATVTHQEMAATEEADI